MANIQKRTNTQIEQKLAQITELQDISVANQENFALIIDQALNFPSGASRWIAYEALKRQGKLLAGWNSGSDHLTTIHHYDAMIDFIDFLLPQTANEDEVPQSQRYINPDELSAWEQRAQQILLKQRKQRGLPDPAPRTAGFTQLGDIIREEFSWLTLPEAKDEE